MIDERNKIIYVDFSTLATFDDCKEKARLRNVIGWQPQTTKLWFPFGHAWHAGIGGYYDAQAGGWHDEVGQWHLFEGQPPSPVDAARTAFLRSLKYEDAKLPLNLEAPERRSVERGLALVEAYIERWRSEPYENILRDDGSPYTEVGFVYDIALFGEYRVRMVGYIDRIMRDFITKRPVIFERKTTTMGLSQFTLQVKPNHQISTYFVSAQALFPEIRDCVWDCAFISDRKPDVEKSIKGNRFWLYGVDIEKDFMRVKTSRSATDLSEFQFDAENRALDYCKWLTSGVTRWPRSTGACHAYGGCTFRDRCSKNFDDVDTERAFMETFFKIEKWEPWRAIVEKIQ